LNPALPFGGNEAELAGPGAFQLIDILEMDIGAVTESLPELCPKQPLVGLAVPLARTIRTINCPRRLCRICASRMFTRSLKM